MIESLSLFPFILLGETLRPESLGFFRGLRSLLIAILIPVIELGRFALNISRDT